MRLVPLFASLLAVASSLAPTAVACGFVAPTLFHVSSHVVPGGAQRSFVVLRTTPHVADSAWQALSPRSYDSTRIAELPALEVPAVMTLVGPSGTRVVEARHEVALTGGSELHDTARAALEVSLGAHDGFVIALPGRVDAVTWHAIAWSYGPTHAIAGTELAISFVKDGVAIRRGTTELATVTGDVRGAVDIGGRRYIVVEQQLGTVTTVDVGAVSAPAASARS